MRGWSENTTIDPSDTADNMAKFLSCLKTALDSTQTGHQETSLRLSPAKSSDAGDDGLTINVKCPLRGFGPLEWPIYLKKMPSSAIASDLVLPLIQAHYDRKREVISLIQTINDKDAVLAKLTDKLDAMGTGLEHVFTALSGRKKASRSSAEDRVKGLAAFSEREWKKALGVEDIGPNKVSDLVDTVFGDSGLEYRPMMEPERSPELDKWWHDFKPTSQLAHRKQPATAISANTTPPPDKSQAANGGEEDDDFQVQSTPPHLRSAEKITARNDVPQDDGASTEIEDDSCMIESNVSTKKPSKHASRLGAIGGKKQPAEPRSPSPPTKVSKQANVPADDEETASEASDTEVILPTVETQPRKAPEETATKMRSKARGMGIIGGGSTRSGKPTKETTPEAEPANVTTTPKKLGKIGGKPAAGTRKSIKVERENEDENRGRAASRNSATSTEDHARETSQERADRKREELKRELEKKAAAGPAKKKRRF